MKKKIAALTLAALMMTGTLTGCASGSGAAVTAASAVSDTNVSATAENIDAEQYLNAPLTSEPSTLDVARFLGVVDRNVMYNFLEPLTRIENGKVVGAGAEKWEISDDGLEYTIHLRENYWSDGKKVTAADYAYAIQRQATPANAFSFASDLFSIKNMEDIYNGTKDISELGVEVVDDSTLKLHLSTADPTLFSNVDFFPCREDMVEKYGDAYGSEAESLVSCGPFILKDWVHNSSLDFVKNDKYWDAGSVKLQKFTFSIIGEVSATMAALENGSLDYAALSSKEYITKFSSLSDMRIVSQSAARTWMLVLNCQDKVFSNQKIRMAFSLALDRSQLTDLISSGTSVVASGLIPPDSFVGTLNFREKAGDIMSSLYTQYSDPKALLVEGMQELGLGSDPSSLTVSFAWGATTATARTNAELFQQMWQTALGVNVDLQFNDSATHLSNVNSGKYQMATVSWGANLEPQFQIGRWATKVGGQSRWVNSDYVSLYNAAISETDENERLEKYMEAEKLLIDDAAIFPIYFVNNKYGYHSYVQGVSDNAFDTTGMKYLYTFGR